MQSILTLMKTLSPLGILPRHSFVRSTYFSTFQNVPNREKLLTPFVPVINLVCSFKVKGRVKRRCSSCYIVVRDERKYVICPKYPRHKQMSMKPKPHNTWILTHATQSPVRPW